MMRPSFSLKPEVGFFHWII